jgi:hypothetical protein
VSPPNPFQMPPILSNSPESIPTDPEAKPTSSSEAYREESNITWSCAWSLSDAHPRSRHSCLCSCQARRRTSPTRCSRRAGRSAVRSFAGAKHNVGDALGWVWVGMGVGCWVGSVDILSNQPSSQQKKQTAPNLEFKTISYRAELFSRKSPDGNFELAGGMAF